MNILLTGGLGFIGSHTASVLVSKGYNPILLDNLCNSQLETVDRLEQIAGKKLIFCNADVRDINAVSRILKEQQINAVENMIFPIGGKLHVEANDSQVLITAIS